VLPPILALGGEGLIVCFVYVLLFGLCRVEIQSRFVDAQWVGAGITIAHDPLQRVRQLSQNRSSLHAFQLRCVFQYTD
jgi:hypothetical protein